MKITIIGAGPGGYIAAFEAAKLGAEVTLIEKDKLGGTCLNYGCIPTKTLKASAEALESAKRATEFGLSGTCQLSADMPAVIARKNKVSEVLRGGIEKSCAKLKITTIYGQANVISSSLTKVKQNDGQDVEIISDKVILATGSSSLELPSLPIDHKHIISSDDALELDYIPKSATIIGGGVIGTELAFILNTFGTKITVIEGLGRILPIASVDEEMSKLIQREMKKKGINVELNKLVSDPSSLESEIIIVSVGRVPNTKGLGLTEAGIELDKRGWVICDDYFETNIKGIYAIGDLLGPSKVMLAHVASAEGLVACHNAILGNKEKLDYLVPSAIFTSPEIADVGLTQAQALEQNIEVDCPIMQFRELGKAQAMGELAGLFKLIIEKSSGKILGCHIAGAHATDLIAEATLAIKMNCTVTDLAHTIHAHPTLAEGLFEISHNYL